MRVSGRSRVFALLGDPVAHSVSPAMQNAAFQVLGLDAVYVPLRCDAEAVPALMRALVTAGGGGNVTVPHKRVAAAAVHRLEGGVPDVCNTFWGEGNDLVGDCTDVAGIRAGLAAIGAPATTWLILGTGGSAGAAIAAATSAGAAVAIRSRSPERAERMRNQATRAGLTLVDPVDCVVAINATPLGLSLDDPLPVSAEETPRLGWALDLVYRPGATRWVAAMRLAGAQAADGREVLVAQGAAALERWFPGRRAPVEVMRAAVARALG
jgi:shikimate dehydrogenase